VKKPPKVKLERKVQPMIVADVKAIGGLACKVLPFNIIGIPDLLIALPGIGMFLMEVKKDDGELSAIQVARIEWLRSIGVTVYVINGIPEWISLRNRLLPGH